MLGAVLGGARTYEDTRARFRLQLPRGWVLAPKFGDLDGMVFSRSFARGSSGLVQFAVRVKPDQSMAEVKRGLEGTLNQEGGFTPAGRRRTKIRGYPAERLEYHARHGTQGRTQKTTRIWLFRAFEKTYIIRLEGQKSDLRRVHREVTKMLRSFEPLSASAARPSRSPSSRPSLAKPQKAPRPSPERSAPELGAESLVGLWKARAGQGQSSSVVILRLDEGGRFLFESFSGTWRVDQGALVLQARPTETIRYECRLKGDSLVLSKGDLDAPIFFERVRS